MSAPSWEQLHHRWAEDLGSRCDLVVEGADPLVWPRVMDALRAASWPTAYEVDGAERPLPADVDDVFRAARAHAVLLRIGLSESLTIHCHFFPPTDVEFDFDPREVANQELLEVLLEFVTLVARAAGRPVAICIEGLDARFRLSAADLRYDPASDAFSVPRRA